MSTVTWCWYVVIGLLDGLATSYLGRVAFSTAWIWWSGRPLYDKLELFGHELSSSWKLNEIGVAAMVAGMACAPFLLGFLRRYREASLQKFLLMSAFAGIVYGWFVATATAVFFVPLAMVKYPHTGHPVITALSTLFGMIIAAPVGGMIALIIDAPVIIGVGTVLGVLNGLMIRCERSRKP